MREQLNDVVVLVILTLDPGKTDDAGTFRMHQMLKNL